MFLPVLYHTTPTPQHCFMLLFDVSITDSCFTLFNDSAVRSWWKGHLCISGHLWLGTGCARRVMKVASLEGEKTGYNLLRFGTFYGFLTNALTNQHIDYYD